jgi:hypothetical protein
LKTATGVALIIIATITLFYFIVSKEMEFIDRCEKAGGAPVVGKGIQACLKRDMVVPVQ